MTNNDRAARMAAVEAACRTVDGMAANGCSGAELVAFVYSLPARTIPGVSHHIEDKAFDGTVYGDAFHVLCEGTDVPAHLCDPCEAKPYSDHVAYVLSQDAAEAFDSGDAAVREVQGGSGAWVRLGTVAGAIVAGLCPYGASAAAWDPGLLADGSPERNAMALALWVAFLLFFAMVALCGLDIAARSTRLRSLRALPEAEPVRRRVLAPRAR